MKNIARPLWRLEDLLVLCFKPEELRRSLLRMLPTLAPEIPEHQDSPAQFAHAVVALLDRHGSIDARFFAHLLTARPLRRSQILSAATALSVDNTIVDRFLGEGEQTKLFRYPGTSEPRMVDELEVLVLERERASLNDPRREALSEDIERLAAQIRTRRPARAGDRVAGTILEYFIKGGTFGTVWRSHDAETGAARATKIFDLTHLTDGVMLCRFRRSIRVLKILHKGGGAPRSIARVMSEAEDGLSFAMEYLPRGTLEQIEGRRWGISRKIEIFTEICAAVEYAHRAGVIHRDIKPSNVVLGADLRPVLIDFDIADYRFATQQGLTKGGLGTLMFAAPEQMECAGEIDERADIYSLGRLLHYILIGQIPSYNEPDTLLESLPRVPPSLALTIRRATQRRPGDRFVSVSQLRRDVEVYRTGWAAVRAGFRRALHRIRRNAVPLVLAASATTAAMLHADNQEELARTESAFKEEISKQFEAKQLLAVQLEDSQIALEAVRGEHRVLRGRLDAAKRELLALTEDMLEKSPRDRKGLMMRRDALRDEIEALEPSLAAAQQKLDTLTRKHSELMSLLAATRVGEQPSPPAAPAPTVAAAPTAAAPVALPPASDAPAAMSHRPVTPIAEPEERVKKQARRPRPKPLVAVDYIVRLVEVDNALAKLTPAIGGCAKDETVKRITVGVMVDRAGKVTLVKVTGGTVSAKTITCIERVLRRQKFRRFKEDRPSKSHYRSYTLK